MSEKWFVVSESELERLKRAAAVEALVDSLRWGAEDQELYDAEAACRARPVTKSNFADGTIFYEELKR